MIHSDLAHSSTWVDNYTKQIPVYAYSRNQYYQLGKVCGEIDASVRFRLGFGDHAQRNSRYAIRLMRTMRTLEKLGI
jgi:hypothetical protein